MSSKFSRRATSQPLPPICTKGPGERWRFVYPPFLNVTFTYFGVSNTGQALAFTTVLQVPLFQATTIIAYGATFQVPDYTLQIEIIAQPLSNEYSVFIELLPSTPATQFFYAEWTQSNEETPKLDRTQLESQPSPISHAEVTIE